MSVQTVGPAVKCRLGYDPKLRPSRWTTQTEKPSFQEPRRRELGVYNPAAGNPGSRAGHAPWKDAPGHGPEWVCDGLQRY
jgi:hypothetical protein